MPRTLTLTLTSEQEHELLTLRDRAEKPYLRERAAALLQVAEGETTSQVAEEGLLRPRCRQSVSAWVHRYQAEGLSGLEIRAGRGRKPAFSPSAY